MEQVLTNDGKKEKVSVVMCTYNGERYVREQLDTVLSQTYPLYEVIVQDDGSTDHTTDIIREYASQYPIVKFFSNTHEHGVNGNFFSALRKATGDYIAICDQDDRWNRQKIELQMAEIGDNLLCGGHSRAFSDDGSFAYDDPRRPNLSLVRMIFNNQPGHTLLFRSDLLSDIMPADNELYHVSVYDVAFCLAASAFNSFAYVNEPIVEFRRHADATTYNDFHHSLPSVGNVIYIIGWSLRHYREARPRACRLWHARLEFLRALEADTEVCREAQRILELELKGGVWAFFRLQGLMIRNRHRLFHTEGGGCVKWLRAALYPVMQYYHYR